MQLSRLLIPCLLLLSISTSSPIDTTPICLDYNRAKQLYSKIEIAYKYKEIALKSDTVIKNQEVLINDYKYVSMLSDSLYKNETSKFNTCTEELKKEKKLDFFSIIKVGAISSIISFALGITAGVFLSK